MSIHVLSRFLKESQSELGARLVGIVMAHAAGDDGICWKSQENLVLESHLSVRGVRDAIRRLEQLGEIETRQVQRGRSRVNVYRVWCGAVPQYERLPFTVDDPFTEPPAESAASDDRQFEARPPAESDTDDRQIVALTPSFERKEIVRERNHADGSQALVATYVDQAREQGYNPPRRVIGQIARLVGELLDEGQPPEVVANALVLMSERRLHPSTLPTLIAEAALGPPRRRKAISTLDADYERMKAQLRDGA